MIPTDNSPEGQDSHDDRHAPVDPRQVPFLFLMNQAFQQQQAHRGQNEQNGPGVNSRVEFRWNGRTVRSRSPLLALAIGAGVLIMGTLAVVALASVVLPVIVGASLLALVFRRPSTSPQPLQPDEPVREIEVTAKRLD